MTEDSAYLIGLLIGGGKISEDSFQIELPLKHWGEDPKRIGSIARDILVDVQKKFIREFKIQIAPYPGNGVWRISPVETSDLSLMLSKLKSLGLPTKGFLLDTANLSVCKKILGVDKNASSAFLSGLFDARASLTKSHRRFNDSAPVFSLEIPGSTQNFSFVVQICEWLNDFGTITDQILYNHPTQHSPSDPQYKGWKKGFKIRFLARDFLKKNSFALKSKSQDAVTIQTKQKKVGQVQCNLRKLTAPSPVSIHSDIHSTDLPQEVRGKLFFHYLHFCAVLGCKYAPVKEIELMVDKFRELVSATPLLMKDEDYNLIMTYFTNLCAIYFENSQMVCKKSSVKQIIESDEYAQYVHMKPGLAFLFSEKLNGKRHSGNQDDIINSVLSNRINIYEISDTIGAPIALISTETERGIIVSATGTKANSELLNKLISRKDLIVEVVK